MNIILVLFVCWGLEVQVGHSEVLLVIGGAGGSGDMSTVDMIREDMAVVSGAVPNAPISDYGWTAGFIDTSNQVVVCGGVAKRTECQHFDLTTNTWQPKSIMNQGRYNAASSVLDGVYHIFGGYASGYQKSVEKYNSGANSWTTIPEWVLPVNVRYHCAVQHDKYFYIMGGQSSNGKVLRRLDTETDTYTTMADMLESRYRHACAIANIGGEDGILVTGGFDSTMGKWLDSTEFYNFGSGNWQSLGKMNTARCGHGLGILQGKPVVFGGYNFNAGGYLNTVESYDGVTGSWSLESATLSSPKESFAYVKVPHYCL